MDPKRITALVVEDDPALRRLVQSYLAGMKIQVLEASDGRAAIDQLTRNVVDLVCLDLVLPESSGYDLCDFIRKRSGVRNVPVLMMSARSLPEDRAHAEEVGANGYLVKPFSRSAFTRRVSELLGQARHEEGSA